MIVRYKLTRSQLFCFDESAELIVHLPDFSLANSLSTGVSLAIEGVTVQMRVVGLGNQKGKLAVRLAAVDAGLFEKIRCAAPNTSVVLSAS